MLRVAAPIGVVQGVAIVGFDPREKPRINRIRYLAREIIERADFQDLNPLERSDHREVIARIDPPSVIWGFPAQRVEDRAVGKLKAIHGFPTYYFAAARAVIEASR